MLCQIVSPAEFDQVCVVCQHYASAFQSVALYCIELPRPAGIAVRKSLSAHASCIPGTLEPSEERYGARWRGPIFVDIVAGRVSVVPEVVIEKLKVANAIKVRFVREAAIFRPG